jgi:hypothetical protein
LFAGPTLDRGTSAGVLVPTPDGTGVVLIGGHDYLRDLYELECSSSYCNWIHMGKQLNLDREHHLAMYVPDSFVDCEN